MGRQAGNGPQLARQVGPALARVGEIPAGFAWHRTAPPRLRAAGTPLGSGPGSANGRPGTELNAAMCSLLDRPVHGTVTAGQTGRYRQGTILRHASSDCGRIRPSVRKTPHSAAGGCTPNHSLLPRPPDTHTPGGLVRNAPMREHSWQAGRHATSAPRMPSASPATRRQGEPHGALLAGP